MTNTTNVARYNACKAFNTLAKSSFCPYFVLFSSHPLCRNPVTQTPSPYTPLSTRNCSFQRKNGFFFPRRSFIFHSSYNKTFLMARIGTRFTCFTSTQVLSEAWSDSICERRAMLWRTLCLIWLQYFITCNALLAGLLLLVTRAFSSFLQTTSACSQIYFFGYRIGIMLSTASVRCWDWCHQSCN